MPRAKREPTRSRVRDRVGNSEYSQQVVAGGAQIPPVSSLESIRRTLRLTELLTSLAPSSPFTVDVLKGIDDARDAIRDLERRADAVAANRNAGASDLNIFVDELLAALGVPLKWLGGPDGAR